MQKSGRRVFLAFAIAAGALLAAPAHAVDIIGLTSGRFAWSAASGPVAGYAVFVNRNGAGYPAQPDQRVTSLDAVITGSFGDSFVLKVAAYDSSNTLGPFSPESDVHRFVAAPAVLSLSTTSLTGVAVQGQAAATASFTVRNSGGGTLTYSLGDSAGWLTLSPASGTSTGEADTIQVTMDPGSLAPGSYSATITSTATGATGSPATINVAFTVNAPPPALALSPGTLSGSAVQGGAAASSSFTVRNTGGGTLSYAVSDNAAWLSLSPASGTSTGEADTIAVSMNPSGLAPGAYTATITAAATGATGSPGTIAVTFTVNAPSPALALSTSSLSAQGVQGQAAVSTTFGIRNAGGGTLTWSVADDAAWLTLAPASGTSTGETDTITASLSPASLSPGTYTATITATGAGATGSPAAVTVTFVVQDQSVLLTAPGKPVYVP